MKNDIAIVALSLHRFEQNFKDLGYLKPHHKSTIFNMVSAEVEYLLDKQYDERVALSKNDPSASLERLAKIDDALAEARQRREWACAFSGTRCPSLPLKLIHSAQ